MKYGGNCMKKVIMLIVAMSAVMYTVFANGIQDGASKSAGKAVDLTFAAQEVGTTAYVYASTMANMFVEALPAGSNIDVTTTSPGGVGAPVILENGQCDIVIGNGAPTKWACTTGILGNPPVRNVRSVAGGLDEAFINVMFTQSFVDKTGIKTLEDLVAKKYPVRIAVKSPGAFGELACARVLEAYGVTYNDIKAWGGTVTHTGSGAIVSLLKDGRADMTIDHLGPGQSATTELCMTTNMYFPQMSDKALKYLEGVGFDAYTVRPNTWKGQTKEIKSCGSPQVVLVSADLSDDVVYSMTKALCEHTDVLVNASAALRAFNPSRAWEPLKVGAPLHPGAERYYKEKGYIK